MKQTNVWLSAGMLLAALCSSASAAHAQCVVGTQGQKREPSSGANGSYTSDYNTCNTNGFTARVWLNQYQFLTGWKRIQGRRSNACATLPAGYLSVSGDFLNFANGATGFAGRFAAAPVGCTLGTTVSYTITHPDRWFFNRSCSVFHGNCTQSVGTNEYEFPL